MDKKHSGRVARIIVFAVLIAIGALIQNTKGLTIEFGGARCFVLIPLCIILGMGEDELFAGIIGLFGGILWDLTSSVHLGYNAIFLSITCFISAMLVTYIIRNTFITSLVLSVVTIFVYCLTYWLFFIIIKGVNGAEMTLLSFYLPCAIYTAVITPVIWISITPIKKRLDLTGSKEPV